MKKLFLILSLTLTACQGTIIDGESIVLDISSGQYFGKKYKIHFREGLSDTYIYTDFPYRINDTIECSKW